MLNRFERKVLESYRTAFKDLTDIMQDSMGRSHGDQIEAVSQQVERDLNALNRERTYECLAGHGPVARLLKVTRSPKYVKNRRVNLFTYYDPSVNRVSRDYVFSLLEEFFPKDLTHLRQGSDFIVVTDSLQFLTDNCNNYRSGLFYKNHDRQVIACIPVSEPAKSFCLVTLPLTIDDLPTFEWVTWIEVEQDWLVHEHHEIFSKVAFRRAFRSFVNQIFGPPPDPVALSEIEGLFDYIALRVGLGQRDDRRILAVDIDRHRLVVHRQGTSWMMNIQLTHSEDDIETVSWLQLSATKQRQFYDRLSQDYKPFLLI